MVAPNDKDVGKWKQLFIVGGSSNLYRYYGTNMAVPHEAGNRYTSKSSPSLDIYPKDSISYHKDTCSYFFIYPIFIVHKLEIANETINE